VNVGAAGTFVVREPGSKATFRAALLRKLPFEAQFVRDGRDLLRLEKDNPFAAEPSRPDIVRFVSILSRTGRLRATGRVEEWRHTRRSGLSVAPVSSGRCLNNRTVAGFHPPPRRTERADFPHSALLLASQEDLWDVAN